MPSGTTSLTCSVVKMRVLVKVVVYATSWPTVTGSGASEIVTVSDGSATAGAAPRATASTSIASNTETPRRALIGEIVAATRELVKSQSASRVSQPSKLTTS